MYLFELLYFCIAAAIACLASYYVGYFANAAYDELPAAYFMVTVSSIVCMVFLREVIQKIELVKGRLKDDQ